MTDFASVANSGDLSFALALDGKGGGTVRLLEEVSSGGSGSADAIVWMHLHHELDQEDRRLARLPGLDSAVAAALLAEETRPRCTFHEEGVILNLRGVNLNPGADPEDMVSLRLWADKDRIVSVCLRRLMAVEDLLKQVETGKGPRRADDLIAALAHRLVERMEPVLAQLGDDIDQLEEDSAAATPKELQEKVADARLVAIKLKRFIAPQRDALHSFYQGQAAWVGKAAKRRVQEAIDRVTRYAETLDNVRERASILQDQLMFQRGEVMNRQLFILSIVAAIFLPLSFLAGLLGMNVAGIPGAESPTAFVAVCAGMAAFGGLLLWIFRRLKWI